jgi:hypothetical protein
VNKIVDKTRKYGKEVECETLLLGSNSTCRCYRLYLRLNRETGVMEWLVKLEGLLIGISGSRSAARELAEHYQSDFEWSQSLATAN